MIHGNYFCFLELFMFFLELCFVKRFDLILQDLTCIAAFSQTVKNLQPWFTQKLQKKKTDGKCNSLFCSRKSYGSPEEGCLERNPLPLKEPPLLCGSPPDPDEVLRKQRDGEFYTFLCYSSSSIREEDLHLPAGRKPHPDRLPSERFPGKRRPSVLENTRHRRHWSQRTKPGNTFKKHEWNQFEGCYWLTNMFRIHFCSQTCHHFEPFPFIWMYFYLMNASKLSGVGAVCPAEPR